MSVSIESKAYGRVAHENTHLGSPCPRYGICKHPSQGRRRTCDSGGCSICANSVATNSKNDPFGDGQALGSRSPRRYI
jgi:hypothetical protein